MKVSQRFTNILDQVNLNHHGNWYFSLNYNYTKQLFHVRLVINLDCNSIDQLIRYFDFTNPSPDSYCDRPVID